MNKRKGIKVKGLFGHELTLTIDERLKDVKPGRHELEKLAEANRRLKKMKSLPK